MKVLKTFMFVVFATLIVGALTGCGGGDSGGSGGGGSGGGYDTNEFRKIQFWTYEECHQRKVLIESKDLARELDQGYFDNWGEPWFGGVWDSPFPGTTSDLLPAGNYNMCYERKCSDGWKHRYFSLNVPGGWDGQLPDVIEVGNAANWQADNPGGCPVGIGGIGGGGGDGRHRVEENMAVGTSDRGGKQVVGPGAKDHQAPILVQGGFITEIIAPHATRRFAGPDNCSGKITRGVRVEIGN